MENISICPVCEKDKFQDFLKSTDFFLTQEKFTIVKCESCGFLFVNPRPDANKIGSYYKSTNYISHSNTRKGAFNKLYHFIRKRNHKSKLNIIQKYVKPGSVLDIGCATGEFLAYCQKNGWKTTGVEPDESARNYAKNTNSISVYDESYFEKTGGDQFDVVTLWHVLEHVYPLAERIRQIKNLLTEHGLLVVAVPNPNSFDAKFYNEYWAGYDLPRHIYHFGQNQIKELFDKNGFSLTEILPMKFDSYYVSLLSEKYKNGKSNWIKAFFTGWRSNRFAQKNNNEYSSLIYLFSKKKP